VDWIKRRMINEHRLLIRIDSPSKREVIFEKLGSLMSSNNLLGTQKTVGHSGEITWQLAIDQGHDPTRHSRCCKSVAIRKIRSGHIGNNGHNGQIVHKVL